MSKKKAPKKATTLAPVILTTHLRVCAIDPGNKGALVFVGGARPPTIAAMPLDEAGEPNFHGVVDMLARERPDHVFLERAMPFRMPARHAFNYGRGFRTLELAVALSLFPWSMIEPSKWTKKIFSGIDSRLVPKAKAQIALKRLRPDLLALIPHGPKTKKPHDGMVDACLMAIWGINDLGAKAWLPPQTQVSEKDF